MTDMVTAPDGYAPPAIEPERVIVLNEDEQRLLIGTLAYANPDSEAPNPVTRLRSRLTHGDEYANPKDELARVTLRKRRLETEVRRCNKRIADLDEMVVDELIESGDSMVKHAATGATLRLDSKIWAKLDVDVDDLPKDQAEAIKAETKARAGDALIAIGLGDFVRSDFNLNTVSAHFREQVKQWRAEQADLPEQERTVRPVEDFLPDGLRGLLTLTDKPTILVRK